MSLSVGTIETYSTESDQIQYDGLNTQESNSLTLSDSNLWLVDTTGLSDQTTDSFSLYTSTSLYSDGEGYLAPMASTNMESTTGGITMYTRDPNADNILYTSDPSLELSESAPLLAIEGDTQGGSSLSASSGTFGSSTTDSDFTLTNLDATTSDSFASGSLALPGSSGGEGSTAEGSAVAGSTATAIEVTEVASNDLASAADIKAAPFEIHSAIGLLVLGAMIASRRWGWRRQTFMPQLSSAASSTPLPSS
ncbi:hypothetical protein [Nodosilinea sp. E11]|uniref:hypothetical protein n=1 Tax=Nodosilinea sp. E11 TaxID=3037479 RepID=UPI0029345022|nr:hypothetical protein [Nodosilinea sp. E11]WOD41536.1 hypothetical protein RRF56_12095 [Nodosilinea sp. E11]